MQENDYILLLYKQWTGQLDPDEAARLESWLVASPGNEAVAAKLYGLWEQVGAYHPVVAADLEADFKRVQARLRADARPARVVPMSCGRRWLRAAAAVLLLIVGGWGLRAWMTTPEMRTASASGAELRQVSLPDGSNVWLRRDALLEYPGEFASAERLVRLQGEAYFEVAHRPGHPFRVVTAEGDRVEVLGTAFGVRSRSDLQQTEVLVRSGQVRFRPQGSRDFVEVKARQKAVYHRGTARLVLESEATLNELSWQTGGLEFVSTPLEQVIQDLQDHYGVRIRLLNPALLTCRHTAPLTNQPIDKVLATMALTYGLEVSSPAAGQYDLAGGTCR
jgi:transmembrane sensor